MNTGADSRAFTQLNNWANRGPTVYVPKGHLPLGDKAIAS